MTNKVKCPVCNLFYFDERGDYELCPICGWFNDDLQNEMPDYAGGCNHLSQNDHREKWKKHTLPQYIYELIRDNKNRLPSYISKEQLKEISKDED